MLDTADDILRSFPDQVLPVDEAAAEHYATIASAREQARKPVPVGTRPGPTQAGRTRGPDRPSGRLALRLNATPHPPGNR